MRGGKWNLGIISAVLSISLLALYAHRMLKCFPEDNLTCPKYNPSLGNCFNLSCPINYKLPIYTMQGADNIQNKLAF